MSSDLTQALNHPQANAAEQSRMDLQARLNGLGGLNGRKLDPETKAKKLREACEGFESIFIQKMWQEMRNTVPKSNLLSGKEERFWQDMYDQELSKSMTSAGGIGLADMMYEQLSRGLANASKNTAAQVGGAAFTPSAAPLYNPALADIYEQATPAQPTSAPVQTAAIYDGEPEQPGEEEPTTEPAVKPERRHGVIHADTHTRQPGSAVSANNGIDLAYLAKRDAGDKLSANAVRPAMRAKQSPTAKTNPAQPEPAAQAAYGTGESLTAALELAKNGGGIQAQPQSQSLNDLVARAKERNASAAKVTATSTGVSQTTIVSAPQESVASADDAVSRKVRYTTNIPKNAKTGKKAAAAPIRMLNVDNASINSKQGKGLAAYHAAQEAAESSQAPQPVAPLKQAEQADAPTFSIPPLRPTDLKG